MHPSRILLLASALLGASAHADWILSTYPTLACDSAAVRERYGVQTFSNPSSRTNVTVPAAGSLKVEATFASEGTRGYSAELGLLHPLKLDWQSVDISNAEAFGFEVKTSVKPTDGWEFSLGSPVYPEELSSMGTVLLMAFPVASVGTWTRVNITPDMFAYPSWFCDDVAKPCPAITLLDVMRNATNLKISPRTKYRSAGPWESTPCTACVDPSTKAITFEIRNIVLKPFIIDPPPNPLGTGCADQTKKFLLDDFVDGDAENEQGGYWYAFFDTSLAKPLDDATGSSQATVSYADGAVLTASLSKMVGTDWHKYAGWATLGTGFLGDSSVDLRGVTGIGFKVAANQTFSSKVGLNFKVQAKGIADDRPHMVQIPLSLMNGSTEICVRWQDLKQASWVTPKQVLDSTDIQKLSWELKIIDQRDPTIKAAEAAIQLNDVIFYGTTMPPRSKTDAIRGAARRRAGGMTYTQGKLTLRGLESYKSLEVLSVDGARVGSYSLGGRSEVNLQLDLRAGAYFVVARDGLGNRLIQSLAVVR